MTSAVYLGSGGILHRALIFMLKLGWKSRFRLPVLIVVAFVALDISMQLEIALEHENGTEHHAHFK
ncbi:calsequestrin-1 [Vespula squamosa]|uniref:Calsequestrin-1 n=1 Tax=Vespula squamosa TaxID=30214 RepID=A0ABD2A7Y2_VESSQ